MGTFEKLYYISVCFLNNMKHIHTHAAGNKFDRIHNIAEGYYDKASDESDMFVELALEFNEDVQNPAKAAELVGYAINEDNELYWEEAIAAISEEINGYISALEAARNDPGTTPDVQSELDTIIRYWKKENNYKNKMRAKEL